MLRTPSLTPRSGLAGLGLILLAVLVAGGLVFFLWTGTTARGRHSEAAERGSRAHAATEVTEEASDERGAPPVELVPAGTNALAGQATETAAAPQVEADEVVSDVGPDEFALAAAEGDGKVEGPALKYVRGEGKTEVINGKQQRRERRNDRKERQAEEAAAGILPEKKTVESPRKNGDRSQVQKRGSQVGKPERRPKKDAPKDPPQDG
ncbi:MAG: hypothetical protein ABL998_17090 [Planctomycetota bacterium]